VSSKGEQVSEFGGGSGEEERSAGEVTGGWIKSPNKIVREWQFLGEHERNDARDDFPFNSKV
jgi:hypothetical protein